MTVTESKNHAAVRPTKTTLFFRSFLPWQFVRFIVINFKMSVMILKSHGRNLEPVKPDKNKVL